MNRTQKTAWFNVVGTLLTTAIIIWVIVRLVILKTIPEGVERFWPLAVFCVLMVSSIVLMRKKQSPAEVDSDERDNLIKSKAVLASFVSVWALLAAASVIPQFVVGTKGSIPVWLLAFINVGILLIALSVYSVAILIQYGWKEKNHE